ncbi:PAS domain S-box protein [Novipirellula rosea]|uniref:histidine kinase n=1 Tax=Novipirellula rosea TaxID=1031540 RepID=A0ABP8MAH2_9BACT
MPSKKKPFTPDLTAILDAAGAMMIACDLDGTVRMFNAAAERQLGWNAGEVVGRHTPELWHDHDEIVRRAAELSQELGQEISADFQVFSRKVMSHNEEPREWTFIRKDGTRFPVQLVVSTIRDTSDAVTGFLGTAQDISHRVQAESERDQLFKLSVDLLCVASIDGYFKRVNPAFSRILGWSEKELLSRRFLDFVHPEDRKTTEQVVNRQIDGESVVAFDNRYQCKDGSWRILSWTSSPQHDGLMFASARDVTQLRRAEEKLQQLNDDLERRITERTKELAKEQRWLRSGHLVLESIASESTFSDTAELIARFVTEEVAVTYFGILLYDATSDSFEFGSQRNLPDDFDQTLNVPRRGKQVDWIRQAVQLGRRVVINDLDTAESAVERRLHASGREWKSGWAEPIVGSDGKVQGVFVALREQVGSPDENELKCVECACGLARIAISRDQARTELKASERRYRTLLEHVPAPLFVYDRESLEYLAASDRSVCEYGYSREELMQMTILDIRPEEDVPELRKMLDESGAAFEHRGLWRHRKKDGSLIDVEIMTHGLDLEGRSACIVLATDVTEKLRIQNSLRRSESLNQALLQSSLDSIVAMNAAGEIVEFNRAAEQTFGYSRAQALGRSVEELMIPNDLRAEHKRGLAHYLATGEERIVGRRVRTTAQRSNGETFPIELTVVPAEIDGEQLFAAYLRDLTLTLRSEQELHRTTELLQAIADGTTDAIFVKDLQGRYLLFNKAATELTGRISDEVLGKNDVFLFGEEHGWVAMENDRMVMQSNQPHTIEEKLTAGGVTRSYLAMKAPLRDPNGSVIGVIGVSRDITERKLIESSLQESEERYRSIVEQSPDMIFINRDNRVSFINQAGVDLLGASSDEEIIGRSPTEFFHPDDQQYVRQQVAQLLSEPGSVPVIGARILALDGRVIDVDVQGASYYSRAKLEIQVVCRDVSERKRSERELQRHIRHTEFSAAKGIALSQATTLPEMLKACTEAMVKCLNASSAQIWTLNESEGLLELQASAGTNTRLGVASARVPLGRHKVGRIAVEKAPYLTTLVPDYPGASDQFDSVPDSIASQGLDAFAGYPLMVEDRCVGVIAMESDENLEQETLDCLARAADSIAQGIARKQSEAMLADLNLTLEHRVRDRSLELKQSERFNQVTLDSLSAHIAVVNCDGNIVTTNAAWRKFAEENQASPQSVSKDVNYLDVCGVAAKRGDSDASSVAKALREILAGKRSSWDQEYACHTPDRRLWFICRMKLVYINEQPHAVIAHENVTKIKEAQVEMHEAKEKAVQASLAKSEFLAAMSHELRTPLNGILGMNTLLLKTDLNDRQRRFVEACASSGKLLAELINDVLDLSKIEAGKLELDSRECELERVVYGVIELFSSSAQENELSLSCQLSQAACVTARIDDNRLRQILVNLIGNAIKFTSSGSVSIAGDRIKHSSGQSRLRIEITDTGIGIPPERMNRLFKPFSQVDSSTTRNFGGTGLGLSICRQLVALMGGEIGVESQVGIGSTFWFEIPLEVISQPEIQSARRQSLAGTQILVVDGIGSLAQIIECVTNWGCHYVHVNTFQESLQILQSLTVERTASVVVFSSFQAIKDEPDASQTLIDLCSGRLVALLTPDEEMSAQRMLSRSVDATLQEPVRPSDLFDVITSLLFPSDADEGTEREPSHLVSSALMPAKLTGHLLVAEDNRINQLYVVELLKMLGCTCDIVANGEEVLSILEHGPYDLVLMDCQMPEMDGFTATQEIRRREANANLPKHIPIVAVTANALTGDRERCLEAGMDDYVQKPIDGDQLRMTLSKFLSPAISSSPLLDEVP